MSRRILNEIYDHGCKRRALIIERTPGFFRFEEEYFTDTPREMCWCMYGQYLKSICASSEVDLAEAKGRIEWLRTLVMDDA